MKVYAGTPFYETVTGFFHVGMMSIAGRGLLAGQLAEHGGDVVAQRNRIAERFMESDGDWLWWVDSDQVPSPQTLEMLLWGADEKAAKVVGALVPIPSPESVRPNLWTLVDGELCQLVERPEERWFRGLTGTGCLLVHRDVFAALGGDWFDRKRLLDGTLVGEDLSFTMRATMAGFDVWVDTRNVCRHRKAVTFG